MAVVLWLLIGLVAGWLAQRVLPRRHGLVVRLLRLGLLVDLLLGLAGALVGGLVARAVLSAHGPFANAQIEQFRVATQHLTLTSASIVGHIVVAVAGAVLLLAADRLLFPPRRLGLVPRRRRRLW